MKAELKPEELRVNNYYQYLSGDPFQLGMDDFGRLKDLPKHLWPQGIELSEDWLMRGQFSKNAVGNWVKRYGESNFKHFTVRVENGKFYYPTGKHKRIELPYVHTLQNLYYLATGNELIFNHG